ncbi:MAG: hypothetical protein HY549_11640 [Elusimicrobia bacterium]|nr:hypothetical protein [Elusimicrobiota bacterium]
MPLTLALALTGQAFGAEPQSHFPLFPYTNEGPFVTAPARFVAALPQQAGFITGAALCLPVSLFQDARSKGGVTDQKAASLTCGKWMSLGLGWPVYAAAGLPFFILKKIFWDGPRAIL